MICSCCGKQKATIKPRQSQLIPGVNLLSCEDCTAKKFEPRAFIVLRGRSAGPQAVRDYVLNHRYTGEKILAEELTV